jgi:hypothetical protein
LAGADEVVTTLTTLAWADEVRCRRRRADEVEWADVTTLTSTSTKLVGAEVDVDEDVDKARRSFEVPTKFKVRPIELETVPRASQVRG